jgi:hypothetical protein
MDHNRTTDGIVPKLALIGCLPEPLFARRAINWRALCPCRTLFDGHCLTILRTPDGRPILSCEQGASEQRILDELDAAAKSAEFAYGEIFWGMAA